MKTIQALLALLLLTVLFGGCAPVPAKKAVQLPPGTLGAAEVTALFSGQTAESILASNGRVSLTYYHPDGTLRQLQDGQRRSGTWQVRDDGRICLGFPGERERCRIIVKEGPVYRKYIVKENGQHEAIITYRSFRKGNLVD